jgi:hypothetical protein
MKLLRVVIVPGLNIDSPSMAGMTNAFLMVGDK